MLQLKPWVHAPYTDAQLDPYHTYIPALDNISNDPYHNGRNLIKLIQSYQMHEIGSHSFTHIYCMEPGQSRQHFEADTLAFGTIAKEQNLIIESIVFPRNQVNDDYLPVLEAQGYTNYRGTLSHWLYNAYSSRGNTPLKRIVRLIDAYCNISGHNSFDPLSQKVKCGLVNIPGSRFLRPYSRKLKVLEPLRLRRITKSLRYAAQQKQCYHLWWHPHNFGINQDQNLAALETILQCYATMRETYGMQAITMANLSKIVKEKSK
jgi:hypothetical protein